LSKELTSRNVSRIVYYGKQKIAHEHGASIINLNILLATLKFSGLLKPFSSVDYVQTDMAVCMSALDFFTKSKIDQLLLHCTCNRGIFFGIAHVSPLPIFFLIPSRIVHRILDGRDKPDLR